MELNIKIEIKCYDDKSMSLKIDDGRFVIQHSHYLDFWELLQDLRQIITVKVRNAYIQEKNADTKKT